MSMKLKDYFIAEIKERELMIKGLANALFLLNILISH